MSTLPTMTTPSIRANPHFNPQSTAHALREAMKVVSSGGCDKAKVIRAIVNCDNAQRQEVIRVFKQMYGKELVAELVKELSGGNFAELIIALMEHPARYDAQQVHRAMEGPVIKKHVLIEIMTTRTNAQIYEMKQAYNSMFGSDLELDLAGKTSGHFARLLVSLCSGARDESCQTDPIKANQDAKRMWNADHETFNAILCAQNCAQLRLVLDEYPKQHGQFIEQSLNEELRNGNICNDIRNAYFALVEGIRDRPSYFAGLFYDYITGVGTDTDLIRLMVSRSEVDLGAIRQAYLKLSGTTLENDIAEHCSGHYKDCLLAIIKGYY